MNTLQHFRPAVVMVALFTLLTGVVYPLTVTAMAQLFLPFQANGSLIRDSAGRVSGSTLIAQDFSAPGYLHPRPSAAGDKGFDATASSGSNLGPMDKKLADRVADTAKVLSAESAAVIPTDAVTTSGSGLDPDISPQNALRQVDRIAQARGINANNIRRVIAQFTNPPALGFLGQPGVNVLMVNRALDREHPLRH